MRLTLLRQLTLLNGKVERDLKKTDVSLGENKGRQESCAIAKMTAHAPYTWCPKNFRDSLTTPTATIPNIFHGLLF